MSDNTFVKFKANYKFHQSIARDSFKYLNEFRTSDTWQWDYVKKSKWNPETHKMETVKVLEKVPVTGREELVYDYELERIAMQRAAELSCKYAHKRPNRTYFGDEESNEIQWKLRCENGGNKNLRITPLDKQAEAFIESFKEEDCSYDNQGHRRGMLDIKAKTVG